MKTAKLIKITKKSIAFECPYCENTIRSVKPEKFKAPNYGKFVTCHKCRNRVLLNGPNRVKISGKVICPKCKKNKMCVRSSQCMKCYKKGNIRGVQKTRRSKDVDKFTGY